MDRLEVTNLIQSFRIRELRSLLFTNESSLCKRYLDHDLLLNLSTILPSMDESREGDRRDTAYTIIEFERFNRQPAVFTEILHSALLSAAHQQDALLVEVMIHSGGNLFYPVSGTSGSVYNEISQFPCLTDVIDMYFPGVWNAVETGNIEDLRRLVNYWCSTDVYLNGESLIQLAIRMGHESVIRLVTGAHYTLKLIHSFLGGNLIAMQQLLIQPVEPMFSGYGINLDFKHLSDNGAPLLYYVIQRNEVEIARLLINHGCRIYTLMRCPDHEKKEAAGDDAVKRAEYGRDVPVFYWALKNPNLDPDMMAALLSGGLQEPDWMQDLLYSMMFSGQNCVEVAIRNSLNLDAFRILVQNAGAKVIADRNADRETVRDVAKDAQRQDYIDVIDAYVIECLQEPHRHPYQRQILALFGYDLSSLVLHEAPVDAFYSLYHEYQFQIKCLGKAIQNDDYETFQSQSVWRGEGMMILNNASSSSSPSSSTTATASQEFLFERLLLWDGREGYENPLPLLHRAVIYNRLSFVILILQMKPFGQSIDGLFDHYRRTALHYAEASKELSEIRSLLRQYGCSDHILDRDFKMLQGKKSMARLLECFRSADFSSPEPKPFKALDKLKQQYASISQDQVDGFPNEAESGEEGLGDDESDEEEEEEDEEDDEVEDNNPAAGPFEYILRCTIL